MCRMILEWGILQTGTWTRSGDEASAQEAECVGWARHASRTPNARAGCDQDTGRGRATVWRVRLSLSRTHDADVQQGRDRAGAGISRRPALSERKGKPMIFEAKAEHEVAYQELAELIHRHADSMTALEVLAVAANIVGKLVALQDQRTITAEQALEVVARNIELGNRQVLGHQQELVGGKVNR